MAKIRLKFGSLEIEYEGDQKFIETNLVGLAQSVAETLSDFRIAEPAENPQSSAHRSSKSSDHLLSTNTIAQAIDSKTGSDLVMAAVAKLIIVNGAPSATRHTILTEMKEAPTYFKETYMSNLSSYLNTLVRSRKLNLVSKDTYSIPATERNRLEEAVRSAT